MPTCTGAISARRLSEGSSSISEVGFGSKHGRPRVYPLVKGGRLVSEANERGDFLPLPLSLTSHKRMRALSVVRCCPSARQQPCAGLVQCQRKAVIPTWLAKIPPLACGLNYVNESPL